MVSTEIILLIVNICISSITSLFLPLFQSLSFCIKHIYKLDSPCGNLELRQSNIQKKKKSKDENKKQNDSI
jgi:hypothetical protein